MSHEDNQRDVDARDAHLLAALRHAPDRDDAPPPALSAAILASAKAAARQTARLHGAPVAPARRSWRERLDAWLGGPRAPWAAAFGSLAAGTIAMLMWSTAEPPLPAPPAPAASTTPTPAPSAKEQVPAAMPAQAAKEASPASGAEPISSREADTSADRGGPRAVAADRKQSAGSPFADSKVPELPSSPPSPLPKTKAEASPKPAPARQEIKQAPALDAAPPIAATGAAAAAEPTPASSAALPPPTALAAPDVAARVPEQRRATPEAAAAAAVSGALADRLARERGGAVAKTASPTPSPSPTPDVIDRLDAALATAAGEPVWTVGSGAVQARAHGLEQRQWWASVRAATQGRWVQVVDERGTREAAAAVPWVTLSVSGQPTAVLWADSGALWLRTGAALWRAPASEALLRQWQEMVARW